MSLELGLSTTMSLERLAFRTNLSTRTSRLLLALSNDLPPRNRVEMLCLCDAEKSGSRPSMCIRSGFCAEARRVDSASRRLTGSPTSCA